MNVQTWQKSNTTTIDHKTPQVYFKLSANDSTEYYAVSRTPDGRKWQVWISGECLILSARTMAEAKAAAYQHEAELAHVVAIHEDARRTEVITETHRKLGAMVQAADMGHVMDQVTGSIGSTFTVEQVNPDGAREVLSTTPLKVYTVSLITAETPAAPTGVVETELIGTSGESAAKRAKWTLIHARTYGDIDNIEWVSVEETVCRWYALCENTAVSFETHPTLGEVPICDRCKAKAHA